MDIDLEIANDLVSHDTDENIHEDIEMDSPENNDIDLQIANEKVSNADVDKNNHADIEMNDVVPEHSHSHSHSHSTISEISQLQSNDDTVFEEPHWLHVVDLYIWRIKIVAILCLYSIEPFKHSIFAGFMYFVYLIFIFIALYFIYYRQFGKEYFIATCRMFVIGIFCTELYFSDRGFIKKWEDAVHDTMKQGFFATIVIICIVCTIFIGIYSWKSTHSASQTIQKIFGIYSTPFNVHYAESDKIIKIELDNNQEMSLDKIKNEHESLRNESIIGINGKLCLSVHELEHEWNDMDKTANKSVYFTVSKSDNEGDCMRNWLLLIAWMFRLWFVVYMFGVLSNYLITKALDIADTNKDDAVLRKTQYGDIYTFDSVQAAMTLAFGASGFCQEACLFMTAATFFMMPEFKKIKQAPFVFIFWSAFTFSFVENVHYFEQRYNVGVLFFRCIFGTISHTLFACVSSYALINGVYGDKLASYKQIMIGVGIYCMAFGVGVCWHGLNDFWFMYDGIYDIDNNAPFVFVSVFIPASMCIVYGIWMKMYQDREANRLKKYFGYSLIGTSIWLGFMILFWIVIIPENA